MSLKATLRLVACMLLISGAGHAMAAEGTLACVGRHMDGMPSLSFLLSNFNDSASIVIDSIRVYSASGELLCEGPDGWTDPPPTDLAPNGATWFSINRMISREWCPDVTQEVGWVIIKVGWSSQSVDEGFWFGRMLPLYGRVTEVTPDAGRAVSSCETVGYSLR